MIISIHDEARLTWFFGQGQTEFERSTMGPMLDHCELFGQRGELVYSERALGYELHAERIRRDPAPWGRVHEGAIVTTGREITARPTAETRNASGYTPNDAAMELFADVSGVLRVIERQSWLAVAVLEAWFGDLGAQWALEKKPGRLASLFHLTPAGTKLLAVSADEAATKGQPVVGTPSRRMANEIARAGKSERVRVAVLRCERQATELKRAASEMWCEARREMKAGRGA